MVEYKIGDVLKLIESINDNSVDLIICDPPYFKKSKEKWDNQWKSIDEYLKWCGKWIKECNRIMKDNSSIYLFGMGEPILLLASTLSKYFRWKQTLCWVRGGMRGGHNNYNSRFEMILYYIKGKPVWNEPTMDLDSENRRMTKSSWERIKYGFNKRENDIRAVNLGNVIYYPFISVEGKEKTIFPYAIQKPYKLIKTLILSSSNESDTVFDPFLGSGTTLLACKRLNRNGIGFEINQDCKEIIEERIYDSGKTYFHEDDIW
jgi:DNA modification methylase